MAEIQSAKSSKEFPMTDTEKFIHQLNAKGSNRTTDDNKDISELKPLTDRIPHRGLLLDQSHEVLHEILRYVYPQDLASLSQSCKALNLYIKDNRLLWRAIYLQNFDPPTSNVDSREPHWDEDVKNFISTMRMCHPSPYKKFLKREPDSLELAAKSIIKLASNARIVNQTETKEEESRNLKILQHYLTSLSSAKPFTHNSNLYLLAKQKPESRSPELSQLLAKVHCLAGTRHDSYLHKKKPRPTRAGGSRKATPDSYARARVYDLRLYNEENKWGPWANDGSMNVDWEKLECIMVDLAFNVDLFTHRICTVLKGLWQEPFAGVQSGSYVDQIQHIHLDESGGQQIAAASSSATKQQIEDEGKAARRRELIAQDPYGVTGTWQRIVCFLDYSNFCFLNFSSSPPLTQHRPPTDYEEATRLILMELSVDSIEPVPGSKWPKVHFKGQSRSLHAGWDPNANSRITGTVEMTPELEVRWSTLSHLQGESRWRSEGVQVGGINSARGVIGTWFDKDHDPNGPCGPTAFWKITSSSSSALHHSTTGSGIHHHFDPNHQPAAHHHHHHHHHHDHDHDDSDSEADLDFEPPPSADDEEDSDGLDESDEEVDMGIETDSEIFNLADNNDDGAGNESVHSLHGLVDPDEDAAAFYALHGVYVDELLDATGMIDDSVTTTAAADDSENEGEGDAGLDIEVPEDERVVYEAFMARMTAGRVAGLSSSSEEEQENGDEAGSDGVIRLT